MKSWSPINSFYFNLLSFPGELSRGGTKNRSKLGPPLYFKYPAEKVRLICRSKTYSRGSRKPCFFGHAVLWLFLSGRRAVSQPSGLKPCRPGRRRLTNRLSVRRNARIPAGESCCGPRPGLHSTYVRWLISILSGGD